MIKKSIVQGFIFGVAIVLIASLTVYKKQMATSGTLIDKAEKIEDIITLFALTAEDIQMRTQEYIQEAHKDIDGIIAIADDQRTFLNTAKALDAIVALSNLAIAQNIYEALSLLSPDAAIREEAQKGVVTIQQFFVTQISTNKQLYKSFMAYVEGNARDEELSDQQRYFLTDVEKEFKQQGLSLPDEIVARVATLKNELSALCVEFERNIADDNRSIDVSRDELQGLSDDFINNLTKHDELYALGVDYPTYFTVMSDCAVSQTREKIYSLFSNRAYPANDTVLKAVIAKRDELARLLKYKDFAHLDLDGQMVQNPERAYAFLDDVIERARLKVQEEIATFIAELARFNEGQIILTPDGKLQPWDVAYLENEYKKNYFNIDEQKLADYFPVENTINELLDIYSQFLSINFQKIEAAGLWHEDITAIRVMSKENNELLGTLLLDLYPRPNKYSHAAHTTIIPATYTHDGYRIPDVSVVIANFPKATAEKPSVLTRAFVETFFHEFGHGLHALLGATPIASLSGTHTKTDFVELPSQMLEEWLSDKGILKKVSKHYQTNEQLSDEVIDSIIAMKNISSGYFVTRQAFLAKLSLAYYGAGADKDLYDIMRHEYSRIQPYLEFSSGNHFYASFGHLTNYCAKYYGYLWSKVFALDIFAEIKKHGLLNPEIGQKYVREILSKGGCQDPNELLRAFLGRKPNTTAFFEDMGL